MNEKELNNSFYPHLGTVITDSFSQTYPAINYYIMKAEGSDSRGGEVKEVLDFKTQLTNPYRRCVGGYGRDINIFFLLAEAMWIVLGRKDVSFLTLFNSRMADFSDDGKVFHAPYGYRLRHWGVRTEDNFDDDLVGGKGYDQISDAIRIFTKNQDTRQVVLSIWNPTFDLGFKTKDIPCNDIVMLKIRGGKLITTVQNRSNDLHWGLPTNIFQFSFLTEILAASLGIKLGTQTHNSQSLHIYTWNKTAKVMNENFQNSFDGDDLVWGDLYYHYGAKEREIDFKFFHEVPINRFREVEYVLQIIIDNLINISNGNNEIEEEISHLETSSEYLYITYRLLKIYLEYKLKIASNEKGVDIDVFRHIAISEIEVLEERFVLQNWDIAMLAKNFFYSRLSTKMNHEYLGKL